eukprot:358081-Chlamydomonas_euryale.AAC.2
MLRAGGTLVMLWAGRHRGHASGRPTPWSCFGLADTVVMLRAGGTVVHLHHATPTKHSLARGEEGADWKLIAIRTIAARGSALSRSSVLLCDRHRHVIAPHTAAAA